MKWKDHRHPLPQRGAFRPHIMGRNGMVTAGHYLSAWWGAEMLRRGGNAADAGVAAGLVINVVHNEMASFSGVAPIIFYQRSSGRIHTIAGVGPWPMHLDADHIRAHYGYDLPFGVLRSVVPATPDAWLTSLERFGSLSWKEVAEYPIKLAREGFPVHHFLASNLRTDIADYQRWPENARIYLPHGNPPLPGSVLLQPELAGLLTRLIEAEESVGRGSDRRSRGLNAARDRFYRGDIAHEIAHYYYKQGALITEEDFAAFHVREESPCSVSFLGMDVWGCGPWSQGPVLLLALNVLRNFDLSTYDPFDPSFLHLLVEALKLAFVDWEAYCGDTEFIDTPIDELLSSKYGALRASLIDPRRAHRGIPPYGDPSRGKAVGGNLREPGDQHLIPFDPSETDTSFVCAIDKGGNIFSATPSDGYGWNPIVPGLGIHVAGRGRQSRLERDHPNSLAPGKRPRLTPNPVLATRSGEPYLALGTPGNNRQPQAMLQVLLFMELFDLPPQTAVEMPRVASYSFPASSYPHVSYPGLLRAEETLPEETRRGLRELGHIVEDVPGWTWEMGGVCVIKRHPNGTLWGGADPRRETYSVAF